ncbi:DNA repair protein RecN [Actinomycetaceae bacterium L2_0104]
MIEQVRISNLGVIEEAELNLGPGLTALTGETGAGKTMAVTSLQLLLGAKADATKVRRGASGAVVEGLFTVSAASPVLERITEAGGTFDVDDGVAAVLVARHVPASGRSRSYIGGRSVPTSVLSEIAGDLVTVHGQSDQLRLATPAQQRSALDRFGGEAIAKGLERWRKAWDGFSRAQEDLRAFEAQAKDAARSRLAYEALLAKVDEVNPEAGEEEELRRQAQLLENTEVRYAGFSGAAAYLSGSDSVEDTALSAIAAARRALDEIADDPDVDELVERLDGVEAELSDIANALADLAAHTEADPERLSEIYSRRQALRGLRKDLGMDLDDARAAADEARAALAELGDPEGTRERLEKRLREAQADLDEAGEALHAERSKAARALGALIMKELPELALPDATFDIEVTPGAAPGTHGSDAVSFRLASHRGAPLAPIGKSASGGELSRVMLAVEVSLASGQHEKDHTFLFDEVDAGVGGRAALAVGRRLAELATTCQVLVVTHLAQVAAYAGTQAVVVKELNERSAVTDVVPVSGEDRLSELARMLSGQDSQAARAHAAELLSSADMAP